MAIFKLVKGTEFEAGRIRGRIFDVTFSSSYTTGGELVTPDDVGLLDVVGAKFVGGNAASARLNYRYDTVNRKILVLFPTGGAGVSPTTLIDPAVAAGAGASTTINPGLSKEVGATTNLTTITVRCVFLGF